MLVVMRSFIGDSFTYTYATIQIQIKNVKDHVSDTACRNFLLKLAPMCSAPRMPEKFSIALLLAVGAGRIEPVCEENLVAGYRSKGQRDKTRAIQLWLTSSVQQLELAKHVKEKLAILAGNSFSLRLTVGINLREGNFASFFDADSDEKE